MINKNTTIKKFVLYLLEIVFYKTIFYLIFEKFSLINYIKFIFPFRSISDNFTGCFLIFYLLIPFVNIFLKKLTIKEYNSYLLIILFFFSFLPSFLRVEITFNYVTWFIYIYSIGAYIKLFDCNIFNKNSIWIILCILSIFLSILSLIILPFFGYHKTMLLQDCNKILAITNAVTLFIVFKNIKVPYNKTINVIASTTFGILLIHTVSDSMRKYLWFDLIDLSLIYYNGNLPLYIIGYCLLVFIICSMVDLIRKKTIEKKIVDWLN